MDTFRQSQDFSAKFNIERTNSVWRRLSFAFIFLVFSIGQFCFANSPMEVKYLTNNTSINESYYLALIRAAMDATQEEYGSYTLTNTQEVIASDRKNALLLKGTRINIDRKVGFLIKDPQKKLIKIKQPIMNGFMGYRIPLIRQEEQEKFAKVSSVKDLHHLSMGFGQGWEGHVYRHNGIHVQDVLSIDMMLKMLAGKRFDFIPFSCIEINDNYEIDGRPYPELIPEKTLLIAMNLPVYFYVSPTTPLLAERMEKGLAKIKTNGEMNTIFDIHFGKRLKRLELSKRKIIELTHPDDDGSLGKMDHQRLLKY